MYELLWIILEFRLKIYLNLAACYIGLKIPIEAIKACDYALQIDTYSVKAFYRRGKAIFIILYSIRLDY